MKTEHQPRNQRQRRDPRHQSRGSRQNQMGMDPRATKDFLHIYPEFKASC